MQDLNYQELSDHQKSLLDAAKAACALSYSPHSKFPVGAALRSLDGEIITGSNYESASYSLTSCAEKVALARANMQGCIQITAIAIVAIDNQGITSPCGACRQLLYEAAEREDGDIEVIMASGDLSKIKAAKISELLPFAFGSKDLII